VGSAAGTFDVVDLLAIVVGYVLGVAVAGPVRA